MSEPIVLDAVETMLIKLASAEKERVIRQAETDFAAVIRPVIAKHGLSGDVRFSGQPDGTVVMEGGA